MKNLSTLQVFFHFFLLQYRNFFPVHRRHHFELFVSLACVTALVTFRVTLMMNIGSTGKKVPPKSKEESVTDKKIEGKKEPQNVTGTLTTNKKQGKKGIIF